MKKLTILAVCILTIVSCKNDGAKQDLAMTQLRDSLNQIISQKDNDLIQYYFSDAKTTYEIFQRGLAVSGKPGCFPWPVRPRWALVPYLSFPVSLLKLCLNVVV